MGGYCIYLDSGVCVALDGTWEGQFKTPPTTLDEIKEARESGAAKPEKKEAKPKEEKKKGLYLGKKKAKTKTTTIGKKK